MTTSRKFCRFVKPSQDASRLEVQRLLPSTFEIPVGGICISAFLVVTRGTSNEVLLGRLNPEAPWDELGALGGALLERASKGWMIPSSHLMLFEPPGNAARRILKEQLGLEKLALASPEVFSDVYDHPVAGPNHWDIGYIFKAQMPSGEALSRLPAWKELRFVDVRQTKREELARSHSDVLEFSGFRFSA
jgi:ADP-ribose pyrophosphatase YjhB (NUDIX family)